VEGPRVVMASDLVSNTPDIEPADPNIPIIELFDGQRIALEAIARVSTGREHAKWQVGTACGYKNLPVIRVNESCDGCGMCVEECARGVLKLEEKKGEKKVCITNELECSLCKLCERICELGAIEVAEIEDTFVMYMESDGSYTASDMVIEAVKNIKNRAEKIIELLSV